MNKNLKRKYHLHYAASVIGGFMGGYAIFNHCDIFGNAQTANLIHLVIKLFSADFSGIIYLIMAFSAYVAGNVFAVLAERLIKLDLKLVSLVTSSIAVIVLGLLPSVSNPYTAILPILFAMPVQWYSFRKSGEYVSSTVFSTNNLREAVMSSTKYFIDRDEAQKHRAAFYCLTLLSFHCGVALSCVTSLLFSVSSIWFCLLPIALTLAAYLNTVSLSFRRITRKMNLLQKIH